MIFAKKKKAEPIINHEGIKAAREFDDLVSRHVDGGLQPGDAMDALKRPILTADLDRVRAVRIRMEKAGNAQEWAGAKQLEESTSRRLDEVTAANTPRINALQTELDKLRQEVGRATAAATTASAAVAVMQKNSDFLESEMLLPPVINQEIANLINQSGDRAEWNRISREIKKYRLDGHDSVLQAALAELAALEASWPASIKQDLAALRGFYTSLIR